jgi:hypothetical protein
LGAGLTLDRSHGPKKTFSHAPDVGRQVERLEGGLASNND